MLLSACQLERPPCLPVASTVHSRRAGAVRCTVAHAQPPPLTVGTIIRAAATAGPASSSPHAPGSVVCVQGLSFHPPGVQQPLLDGISMNVPPNSLGLVVGRSGSGKTTLLQVLAGLCEQTSGTVAVAPRLPPGAPGAPPSTKSIDSSGSKQGAKFSARMAAENRLPSTAPPPVSSSSSTGPSGVGAQLAPSSLEQRMARVGLVFQFPERHFLGQDLFSELTFSWPREPAFFMEQQALRARVLKVLQAVRLADIDMSLAPWALSGGQQRRLALAIQLIRQPTVLLLDEPLAGLDWQARLEVVELLQRLKQECSLVVVSHDLREITPLVDCAWEMSAGTLRPMSIKDLKAQAVAGTAAAR